jgi:putative peptide zinc metalloprotease protein
MSASCYPATAHVSVYPFSRQGDGEELVIGRPDTGTFLALPREAIEILDNLAAGSTVGEAQDLYQQQYGERPDLEDLLATLEAKGLVRPAAGREALAWQEPGRQAAGARGGLKYHFTAIPRSLARVLFGPVVLSICGGLVALALVAAFVDPAILPPTDALFFKDSMTLKMLVLTLLSFAIVFFHELGHLIAVRATGVDSRLGISNRLWILVVETDMTGLWAVHKRKRYLPVLGGPIVDATSLSVLLLVLFADHRGWLSLAPFAREILIGGSLIYLLGLVWQCFFFVRTDFYYVLSTYFDCKNLLGDTESHLRNLLAKVVPWRIESVDLSTIPRGEMRVIRFYSVIWVLGRILSLTVFFTVVLPLFFHYAGHIGEAIKAGFSANPYVYLDALLITVFGLVPLLIGLWMWSLSITRRFRRTT